MKNSFLNYIDILANLIVISILTLLLVLNLISNDGDFYYNLFNIFSLLLGIMLFSILLGSAIVDFIGSEDRR